MNTPRPCDASDAQIDELIDTLKDIATPFGLKPVNAETALSNMPYGVALDPKLTGAHVCTDAPCFHRSHIAPEPIKDPPDHPLAAWIFKTYKRDTAIIPKAKAYEIGNELNRLHMALAAARELLDKIAEEQAK